jgi:poly-D-alanine transfer protein DltD
MKNNYWIVIIIFIVAVCFSKLCANYFFPKAFVSPKAETSTINAHYIPSIKGLNINNKDLLHVFTDSTLLIWGSSELSVKSTLRPNCLLQSCFGKTATAVGEAGAQSFAALSFLASHKYTIKNKQIVLFVSSNWFCGNFAKGTHPELFLDFFDYDNYNKKIIDENTESKISTYFFEHYNDLQFEFESTSKFILGKTNVVKLLSKAIKGYLKWLSETIKTYFIDSTKIESRKSETEKTVVDFEVRKAKINDFNLFMDSIKNTENLAFLKKCSNNNLGIDSSYFANYCIGKIPFQLVPLEPEKNQELKDLDALLSYLKVENFKTLVVLLPVNALAYDCKPFNQFQNNIEQLVLKNKFEYLNLFIADKSTYKLGMCVDIMHTGPLSWIEINKKIIQTFYPNEIRN